MHFHWLLPKLLYKQKISPVKIPTIQGNKIYISDEDDKINYNESEEIPSIFHVINNKGDIYLYTLKYKFKIAKDKIKSNEITEDKMKQEEFQKVFFVNTFENYPNLTYDDISLNSLTL